MFTITRVMCGIGATLSLFALNSIAAETGKAPYGFGVTPSPVELQKFYSSLPDGRGLPSGSGSVAQGKIVYQEQCVACHGQKLEGGIGDRLVGGRGTLVKSASTKAPVKTVESYWPYATTLFDYIKRSMPFMAPDSLTNGQAYAVTAYILSEAKIVGPDAVLNEKTLPAVKMPNRDGFIPDRRPEKFPPASKTPHEIKSMVAPSK